MNTYMIVLKCVHVRLYLEIVLFATFTEVELFIPSHYTLSNLFG